jgi:RNA polymerase sigma-70 factor (ECF subfamily)
VKRSVREEHYQIFDLYVLKEWPATKVARVLGVSLGQVYIAKHRVASMVRKELKALETKY